MNTYRVKRIDLTGIKTPEEYWSRVETAGIVYCVGVKALRAYCGGRLHRERCGYAGINGNIEYVAEKI